MKKTAKTIKEKLTAGATVMVSLSAFSPLSVVAATATLPIFAKIVRALEITINTSMDFGLLAVTDDVAGKVSLDPASGELRFDGKGGIALAGGVPQPGRIQIKGAPIPVTVSMETNNIQLSNGATFLTVYDFNFITPGNGAAVTVTPSGAGDAVTLPVGASLNTRPGQVSGTYVGTNRIFANYQ